MISALDQEGGWTGMGAPLDGRAGLELHHTSNDDAGRPDWDDDDLAAMQAEPMVQNFRLDPQNYRCSVQCHMHCQLATWLLCSKNLYRGFLEFRC